VGHVRAAPHSDPRGTVERDHTEYGTSILGRDDERNREQRENLKFRPVTLTPEQRLFIENVIPEICARGHWEYLAGAAGPDHVHVVLHSTFDPETIRKLLKRWIGQELSTRWPREGGSTWWAEDGSIKWAFDEPYKANTIGYVSRQRTTRS
jgi:REP element-mobilizing transposase RayT